MKACTKYPMQVRFEVFHGLVPEVAYYAGEDCSLFVMNPDGLFLNKECAHDETTKRGGTWHWVERVTEDE